MDTKRRKTLSYVDISVSGYLARWASARFERNAVTGGVVLPARLNVHHCLWHLLERRRKNSRPSPRECNLRLHLAFHRDGWKNPAFWNYLSAHSVHVVECELRRLFYMEFRHWMTDRPEPLLKDRCHAFARRYGLTLDDEETVLRTWRRLLRQEREFILSNE